MKVAVRSYGTYRDNLEGFGGLELRYTVHLAHFLRNEGHTVSFFDYEAGCGPEIDLAFDAPRERCDHILSKIHVHTRFSPYDSIKYDITEAHCNPCYISGRFILSLPYKYGYDAVLAAPYRDKYAHVVFLPIPYTDDMLPPGLVPGFDRKIIFWGNKGNFNSEFGPERCMHYVDNGLNTLRALVKLNQRADFTVVFALDSLIRTTRPEWREEVEALIVQLRDVQRLDHLPWSQYVRIMGQTKINTHVGDLTSGINECLLVSSVPAASEGFIFFQNVCRELKLMPPAEIATVDEIYAAYERLWFDREHYENVSRAFQAAFEDHRTQAVRKHWNNFLQIIQEG